MPAIFDEKYATIMARTIASQVIASRQTASHIFGFESVFALLRLLLRRLGHTTTVHQFRGPGKGQKSTLRQVGYGRAATGEEQIR